MHNIHKTAAKYAAFLSEHMVSGLSPFLIFAEHFFVD